MISQQLIKIPIDRVGALVGKEGTVKAEIEERSGVKIVVDGSSGDVKISYDSESVSDSDPFKASEVVTAIGRGFSPSKAMTLFDEGMGLTIIDLRQYSGKSDNALKRIRSRLIGSEGKARKIIEQLSETQISIYGHTFAIIGQTNESRIAQDAVEKLASGGTHKAAYQMLQKYRTKQKLDRMQLWESQTPPEERES
jgi:ribosomal RNA assembly protein